MFKKFDSPKEVAKAIPESARVVLLGECTHGTEEFYTYRAEITKYLIQQRGFKVVGLEADWPLMWHVNEFIHRRRSKIFPPELRFPQWMWKNKPFVDLVKHLRAGQDDSVHVFGLDCYSKEDSQVELQRFLDAHYPDLATRLRFAAPHEWPKLLARLQWHSKSENHGEPTGDAPSELEQFSAEQNLECMIAAEEYYASQQLEPEGSRASWNARDQHMATTLLRIKNLLGDPKVVVWAHNSHVGDSTATPRGGEEFKRNETWNLGQMCRNVLQDVHIVGFYSHQGQVMAAQRWGGVGRAVELLPSLPYSFEHCMHDLLAREGGERAFLQKQAAGPASGKQAAPTFEFTEHALNQEYRILHPYALCTAEADEGSTKLELTERYPSQQFVAVERQTQKYGVVRLKTERGDWITEFTPRHHVTLHCLPASHPHFKMLQQADKEPGKEGDKHKSVVSLDQAAAHLLEFPIMQRWVGVQYCPDTEFTSHYGEILMGLCYDTIVFIDKTKALDTATDESSATQRPTALAVKRLMQEYRSWVKNPPANIQAKPLEDNLLEWHYVITGTQDPYTGGRYHGVLEFPPNFPMAPPTIRMLTPSGRFETNSPICFSMSSFHAELWNPAWTVETILLGIQSFFYEESNQIGGMCVSKEKRRTLAAQSVGFNMKNGLYVELFCGEGRRPMKKKKIAHQGDQDSDLDEEKNPDVCRFCHRPGELVSPCACKGSSQFVHIECLRLWQRSVLLSQPTHPRYQTKIDEICNVCNKPFKYKGQSRRQQIMEFTGEELVRRIRPGNLIVTSRHDSERKLEVLQRHPELRAEVAHWTEAVLLIVRGSSVKKNDYVMAVNVARPMEVLSEDQAYVWRSTFGGAESIQAVNHYIGGPVQPLHPFALLELRAPAPESEIEASDPVSAPVVASSCLNCGRATTAESVKLKRCGRCKVAHFCDRVCQQKAWKAHKSICSKIARRLEEAEEEKLEVHKDGEVPASAMSAEEVKSGMQKLSEEFRDLRVRRFEHSGDLFFGEVEDCCLLADKRWQTLKQPSQLKVFWGCASWESTQLLGELARRSWGLSEQWDERGGLHGLDQGQLRWSDVVDQMSIAKASEYSREA